MKNIVDDNGESGGRGALSYPTYGLERALELGRAVSDLGGANRGVERKLMAARMKMGEAAPSFTSLMSSARCFGIIDRGTQCGLTDFSRRYFFPENDADSTAALADFLIQPRAFKVVIDRFDGNRLPEADFLKNIFQTECRIPLSWSRRVASLFLSSSRFAGVVDSSGFLRIGAAKILARSGDSSSIGARNTESTSGIGRRSAPDVQVASQGEFTVWDDGGSIRVQTPKPMSLDDWKKLAGYVALLDPRKPSEG